MTSALPWRLRASALARCVHRQASTWQSCPRALAERNAAIVYVTLTAECVRDTWPWAACDQHRLLAWTLAIAAMGQPSATSCVAAGI